MTQPVKPVDMRATMPETAAWVSRQRLAWGKAHVNECIRRATVDKEPGFFYAMEGGSVVGTPYPADHPLAEWQQYAVINGCSFAVFMAQPVEATDGKN